MWWTLRDTFILRLYVERISIEEKEDDLHIHKTKIQVKESSGSNGIVVYPRILALVTLCWESLQNVAFWLRWFGHLLGNLFCVDSLVLWYEFRVPTTYVGFYFPFWSTFYNFTATDNLSDIFITNSFILRLNVPN